MSERASERRRQRERAREREREKERKGESERKRERLRKKLTRVAWCIPKRALDARFFAKRKLKMPASGSST